MWPESVDHCRLHWAKHSDCITLWAVRRSQVRLVILTVEPSSCIQRHNLTILTPFWCLYLMPLQWGPSGLTLDCISLGTGDELGVATSFFKQKKKTRWWVLYWLMRANTKRETPDFGTVIYETRVSICVMRMKATQQYYSVRESSYVNHSA